MLWTDWTTSVCRLLGIWVEQGKVTMVLRGPDRGILGDIDVRLENLEELQRNDRIMIRALEEYLVVALKEVPAKGMKYHYEKADNHGR